MSVPVAFQLDDRLRGAVGETARLADMRGAQAYAVGGFVRDLLLGRPVRDIDVALDGDPEAVGAGLVESLGGHFFRLDEERRYVRVQVPGLALHIDLQPLKGTIDEDLGTRDYTIDAMAAPLTELPGGRAQLIDPLGGRNDLRDGLVRAVAEENLRADPLRLLRGVRLATCLGFEIEGQTMVLLRQQATYLREAAAERQRDELMLIMGAENAGRGLRLLDEAGLLSELLPEFEITRGVEQPKEHHWDVFNHSVESVGAMSALLRPERPAEETAGWTWDDLWSGLSWWEDGRGHFEQETSQGTTRAAVLKLACLLHDVGKPQTKSFQADGRMRFFGHAELGSQMAQRLMRRLRFPGREVALVSAMIGAHMRPLQMAQQGPPTRKAVYRFFRDTGDAGIDTLFLSLADHMAAVGPRLTEAGWRRHVAVVDHVMREGLRPGGAAAEVRLVTGDDLMAELGMQPGPEMGQMLEEIREAQATGEIANRDDALKLAHRLLEKSDASP